ncbi:MAG: serine hydrolase domain-containing protein [Microthrixaceae bacterium]
MSAPLAAIDGWGAPFAAAAALRGGEVVARHGDTGRVVRIASITKLVTAWGVLLATEEGAFGLDDPLGPPGSTVRHLLAHAGGFDFDTDRVLAAPGTRRIYSNSGYELLGAHLAERTGMSVADYLAEGVLGPLGMTSSELRGSCAAFLFSAVDDLALLAAELRSPTLLDPSTAAVATTLQFPGLAGVLPGWGRQDPCDWAGGAELRGTKTPHWTGATAPPTTFGHFGGAGTFLWVDPVTDVACVVLTDREFDDWAVAAWPPLSDAVRAAYG